MVLISWFYFVLPLPYTEAKATVSGEEIESSDEPLHHPQLFNEKAHLYACAIWDQTLEKKRPSPRSRSMINSNWKIIYSINLWEMFFIVFGDGFNWQTRRKRALTPLPVCVSSLRECSSFLIIKQNGFLIISRENTSTGIFFHWLSCFLLVLPRKKVICFFFYNLPASLSTRKCSTFDLTCYTILALPQKKVFSCWHQSDSFSDAFVRHFRHVLQQSFLSHRTVR